MSTEDEVNNLVRTMERELGIIPEVNKLPKSVDDVCQVIGNQFEDTARILEERADALERRAAELRKMAEKIGKASVTIPSSLRQWVSTEIEYRDAALKVSMVNPEEV